MKEKVNPGGTFDFRPGISSPDGVHPGWKGIMPDADPSSLPPNNLVMALNVRHEAGQVRSRWGLKKVATLPSPTTGGTEAITWLGTHHMQSTSSRLWVLSGAAVLGVATYWHNPDYNPNWAADGSFDTNGIAGHFSGLGSFAGSMHLFSGKVLYKLDPDPVTSTAIVLGGSPAGTGNCLQEFGGYLYVGTQLAWDGVSFLSTGASIAGISNSCGWRDTYLVGLQYGGAFYSYGTVDGGFTNAALPATYAIPYKNTMVEFRDAVYVASGDRDIWAIIPGVSATVVHTLPVNSVVTGVTVMGDMLFYTYTTSDGLNLTSYIGIYEPDNDSWDDEYVNLTTALVADETDLPQVTALTTYRNRLYVGYGPISGGVSGVATHDQTSLPSGDWYRVFNPGVVTGLKVGS
jgi:hypothetical protein